MRIGLGKLLRHPLLGFLWRFLLIYGLLIFPWPGWNDLYAHYFRQVGTLAFSRDAEKRIVLFQPLEVHHGFSSLNTRMILGNRDQVDSAGNAAVRLMDMDARSLGWVPTALTVALILATPVPWRRRFLAMLAGLVLIHGFILCSLQIWIWDESPNVALITFSPFWKQVVDDLQYTLIVQLGASFSVPLLIWILVTFRSSDRALFASLLSPFDNGSDPRLRTEK